MLSKLGRFLGACGGLAALVTLIGTVYGNKHIPGLTGMEVFFLIGLPAIVVLISVFSVIALGPSLSGAMMLAGAVISLCCWNLVAPLFLFFGGLLMLISKAAKEPLNDKRKTLRRQHGLAGGCAALLCGIFFIVIGRMFLCENDDPRGPVSPESVDMIIRGAVGFIAGIAAIVGALMLGKKNYTAGALLSAAALAYSGALGIYGLYLFLLPALPISIVGVWQLLVDGSAKPQDAGT